jgi:plastocyanin
MKEIALFAAACAFALAPRVSLAAGEVTVGIDNFAFTPAEITVKAGTKVVFVNHDDIPHNVVAQEIKLHSKALDTDDSFSFVFDKPGEVVYFCGLHPMMKGKITVTP